MTLPKPDPRPAIPPHECSEEEAEQLVENSALCGLRPGQPGVSARTWQELATVAVDDPDIRWLGKIVYMWGSETRNNYMNDFHEIHEDGPKTDLRHPGHRKRFGEKALRYGGIDIVLRTLDAFPRGMPIGYNGVLDIFKDAKACQGFISQQAKIEHFLRHYHELVLPHLNALAQKKLDQQLEKWHVSQTEEAMAEREELHKQLRRSMCRAGLQADEDEPRSSLDEASTLRLSSTRVEEVIETLKC